ncbi:hypothetical protein KCP75_22210 [Salmonella enterica subsp. enterica]|nr:hypothetical protein KCP75_22210 [Salmonella enterica subsp. enterica]
MIRSCRMRQVVTMGENRFWKRLPRFRADQNLSQARRYRRWALKWRRLSRAKTLNANNQVLAKVRKRDKALKNNGHDGT